VTQQFPIAAFIFDCTVASHFPDFSARELIHLQEPSAGLGEPGDSAAGQAPFVREVAGLLALGQT
jgi:hypothetical protein